MRNYTVGRIWGIPIRISISLVVFLPVLAWLIGSGQQIATYAALIDGLTGSQLDVDALEAGATPWVIGFLAAVGLFVSVTLHELGHSWMALRYDIGIESITLWILGGIAALERIPREWNREFWIAIAGPAVSVAVAAVCWVGTLAIPDSMPVARFVVGWLAITNLTLTVFNLLPAFPMDGGRILRALLARSRPYGSATRIAARIGVVFAILFGVVGVFGLSPLLVLLALFVYGAATTESRTVLVDELLEGLTVGDIMTRDIEAIAADATVEDFIARMLRERRQLYPVTDGDRVLGVVTLEDLKGVRAADRGETPVRSVMRDVPRVGADGDAFETLVELNEARSTVALVEGASGLLGTLSQGDYAHALDVQGRFASGVGG